MERYPESGHIYLDCLYEQEEQLGPLHPDTLRSMHGLGVVYRLLGQYDLAENLLIPCLSGRQRKLGLEAPETVQTMGALKDLADALQRSRKKTDQVGGG
jgi:serine/threonine-protein kinase